jgi:carbon monoxide dehydrogenase subunit G
MKLTSEITVPAARDAVWRSLSEVVRVGAEPGADGMPAEWTCTVGLLDVDEDAGTATFALRAQQRGGTGLMVGTVHGVAEASGSGTRLALEGDVRVTGAAAGDDQILAHVAREIERRLTAPPATSEAPIGEPAPAASDAPAAEVDRREPLQRFGPPALAVLLGIIAAIVLQRRGGARS